MEANTGSLVGFACFIFHLLIVFRSQIADGMSLPEEDFVLQHGIQTLEGDQQLVDCGILDEG